MTSASAVHFGPHSRRPQFWLFLLLVLGASAWYEGARLYRGWVPHDEGCLTESALRVMHGQLPHRDYIEIYTGGLAYLDALAFRVLGLRFVSMRIVLFAFFLAWVIAVYWIATNMVSEWIAAAVTFFAVLWSLPNYSAAMPSWYNLFFATFGIAALFQFMRARSKKWLFIAGLCAGLSFLAKIAGLYFLAATLLYCVYHEQELARSGGAQSSKRRSAAYSIFVVMSLGLFSGLVFRMIHRGARSGEYLHFLLPVAGLCAYLVRRELSIRQSDSWPRIRQILALTLPLFAGFFVPVGALLVPYIRSNAVHRLLIGLFVLPYLRILSASNHALPLVTLPFAFIVSGPAAIAFLEQGPVRKLLTAASSAILFLLVLFSFSNVLAYRLIWNSVAWTIPILTLFALVHIWKPSSRAPDFDAQHGRLFILLSAAVLCSLVQFPFATPTYWCYVSPLAFLGITSLIATTKHPPHACVAGAAVGYAVYAVFAFTPGFMLHMGLSFAPDQQISQLTAPIAQGLRVDPQDARLYNQLSPLIAEHLVHGTILAGPDSPQIYVLSDTLNPTSAPFDFFEPLTDYDQEVRRILSGRDLHVVVVNHRPQFSPQNVTILSRAIDPSFVGHSSVGDFDVYWRP